MYNVSTSVVIRITTDVLYKYTGYLYVGTKDGSVNAVPQILSGQYLILEAFGS